MYVGITGKDSIIRLMLMSKYYNLEYGRVKQIIAIPESFEAKESDRIDCGLCKENKPLRLFQNYLTTTASISNQI